MRMFLLLIALAGGLILAVAGSALDGQFASHARTGIPAEPARLIA